MFRLVILIFVFLFMGEKVHGQELSVISHYPVSAFVVNRPLPFTVMSDSTIKLYTVTLVNQSSCHSMLDPYYSNTFHIFCRRPELLDANIVIFDAKGKAEIIELKKISIATQRAPSEVMGVVTRPAEEEGS